LRIGDGGVRIARRADPPLRVTANLLNRIKLIWAVQSHSQKYFCFSELQIKLYDSPSHPTEGRIMIVAYAGWDAMDAGDASDESVLQADGEVVWS
jgi:hypothetical protein